MCPQMPNGIFPSREDHFFNNLSFQGKKLFNGQEQSDPKTFFAEFDRVAKVYGIPIRVKLDVLPSFLDSYAKSVIKTLPHSCRRNYTTVRDLLNP